MWCSAEDGDTYRGTLRRLTRARAVQRQKTKGFADFQPVCRSSWRAAFILSVGCCGACSQVPPVDVQPRIVLGISADAPLAGKFQRIDIIVQDQQFNAIFRDSQSFDGMAPVEVPLRGLSDGAFIRATVSAFAAGANAPVITRVVETRTLPGRSLMLPVRFNDECIPRQGERDVSCPGNTCSAGVCVVPFVSPQLLTDYSPKWSQPGEGHCGPIDEVEPAVTIGWPTSPFKPHHNGDLVTPQMGLQGASHFFFSVRMHNADDAHTITHYYGTILSTGRETSVVSIADPYVVNTSGCEVFMLPLILPPEDVAGQTMRLGVTVADGSGNAGHAHVDVALETPTPP